MISLDQIDSFIVATSRFFVKHFFITFIKQMHIVTRNNDNRSIYNFSPYSLEKSHISIVYIVWDSALWFLIYQFGPLTDLLRKHWSTCDLSTLNEQTHYSTPP